MFAGISHQDKLAFFELLDEYFETRPQHRQAAGGPSASSGTTVSAASSTHTNFSVPNSAIASVGNAARAQLMNQIRGPSAQQQDAPGARPAGGSTAGGGSLSSAAPGWQTAGMGLMSKGLGKAGSLASGFQSTPSDGKGPPPAPPAGRKGAGASGLMSSKSFGHVDTANKLSFAKTLFNDPQKQQVPAYQEPPRATPSAAYRSQASALPPPPTRTAAARAPSPEAEQEEGPLAEAIYAFSSNEAGDHSVREKEVVIIVTKTSDDWWTCRNRQTGQEGLVPSAYMKEL